MTTSLHRSRHREIRTHTQLCLRQFALPISIRAVKPIAKSANLSPPLRERCAQLHHQGRESHWNRTSIHGVAARCLCHSASDSRKNRQDLNLQLTTTHG